MIKSIKILSEATMALCLVAPIAISTFDSVSASTIQSSKSNNSIKEAKTGSHDSEPPYQVPSEFKEIDKYVIVKNNQFVINIPNSAKISPKVIEDAQKQLDISNKLVKDNGLTINPLTKSANITSLKTRKLPANENRLESWGFRSIFRSNAAVNTRVNIYYNIFYGALAVQDVSAQLGNVWAEFIAIVGSSIVQNRSQTWADNLSSYNRSHKKSRIYQDINWAAQDSEGVWHD